MPVLITMVITNLYFQTTSHVCTLIQDFFSHHIIMYTKNKSEITAQIQTSMWTIPALSSLIEFTWDYSVNKENPNS